MYISNLPMAKSYAMWGQQRGVFSIEGERELLDSDRLSVVNCR
jgi:hypothetical protein